MSEQGKILEWEEWVRAKHVPQYAQRILDIEPLPLDEAELNYRIYILGHRLATAEATASDYAQQAAELQEQNEELRRKLNHNCPYCPGLREENTVLLHRVADLQGEELRDLEITIGEVLPVELQEKWGLEKLDHARNVQHIFMRACCAILELEKVRTQ